MTNHRITELYTNQEIPTISQASQLWNFLHRLTHYQEHLKVIAQIPYMKEKKLFGLLKQMKKPIPEHMQVIMRD